MGIHICRMLVGALLVFSFLPRAGSADNLMQDAEKVLLTTFMIDYSTPQEIGWWRGWNYSNRQIKHDPDKKTKTGKRDIASCYYPIIGPYDMSDPHVVEYHCQLMKMSGIDGGIFTLGFFNNPNAGSKKYASFARDVMSLYVQYFIMYNLKAVALYEDKAHFLWNKKKMDRVDTVYEVIDDLEKWLKLIKPVQYKIGSRPLVYMFHYGQDVPGKGESRLSPYELQEWKSDFSDKTRPVMVVQWYDIKYKEQLEGYFEWPRIQGMPPEHLSCSYYNDIETEVKIWEEKHHEMYANIANGTFQFVGGTVWPGFDDEGCMGWGDGRRVIPRCNGDVYMYHWKRMVDSDYPVVQIATWNDWNEGTVIEPTHEFGYKYLEMTREFSAYWRKKEPSSANLKMATWIFNLRKRTTSEKVLKIAASASSFIQTGHYSKAERLLTPYVRKYKLDQKRY